MRIGSTVIVGRTQIPMFLRCTKVSVKTSYKINQDNKLSWLTCAFRFSKGKVAEAISWFRFAYMPAALGTTEKFFSVVIIGQVHKNRFT